MKIFFTTILLGTFCLAQSQTILQPGEVVNGTPVRVPSIFSGDPSNSVELITVNNFNVSATEMFASCVDGNQSVIYADTLRFAERTDTIESGQYELRNHQYQYGFTTGGMAIFGGINHRTNGPFIPVAICAGGWLYSAEVGWYASDYEHINWIFSPEAIEYDRFEPRYVSYTTSQHPWNQGIRLTGSFNRIEGGFSTLEVYDIYPEESLPSTKLLDVSLETAFFINHSVESERKLLVSGFEVDEEASFIKRPKALLIDLETGAYQEMSFPYSSNNLEVLSGLIDEEYTFLIIKETDVSGELVESRVLKFGDEETMIATFGAGFTPTDIVSKSNHGVLVGGNYSRFGLKTAAVYEIEGNQGLKRMIGFADLGNVKTKFRAFIETSLGEMIVGHYDSLNGSPKGSFMTPIVRESLLEVNELEKSELGQLFGESLRLFNAKTEVRIVDFSGKTHFRETVNGLGVNLNILPNGVYLINLISEEKSQTLKTVLINH